MAEHAEGGTDYSGLVFVNYSGYDDTDCDEVIRLIRERFPKIAGLKKLHIGPTIGGIGAAANYSGLTVFAKWYMSILMLIGRLEIFTVLFLFMPKAWRI